MKDGDRMKGSLKEQRTKRGLARRWTGKLRTLMSRRGKTAKFSSTVQSV